MDYTDDCVEALTLYTPGSKVRCARRYPAHALILCSCLSIKFEINGGKENFVDFSTGQEATAYKDKNGHLMVVSVKPPD